MLLKKDSATVLTQVPEDAWVSINAMAVVKRLPDARQQDIVGQGAFGLWIGLPSVIDTALYAQNAAHAAEPKLAFVFGHECVLHPDSLAKYVAALFRLSRSSLALLSSVLSRDTSALRWLVSAPLCSIALWQAAPTGTGFCPTCPIAWLHPLPHDHARSPA